ncbi:MAG: hypothetical protein GWM90_33805, partial [Gemmatimonadetes bacterium]|nr:hypothetical protein [Gemmatimonadota bacterium]NIQ60311.1 hypothetical protein [Gemmatimonadota bacterium]NIU80529.1 hypothetical protein [Gammaproteobacteria bacterium]NIX48851.1 hypothetical protein [Gemmatimonadota bacterium]NIY13304.1 hypothetical protein [Gemmatimonadota bacterium]
TLTATRARVADLPWVRGEVPEDATGSFRLALEPRPGDRTALRMTDLALSAPGSSATGSMVAILGGESPILESIDVRVDPLSLDLVEAFTGPLPYGGQVSGQIQGGGGEIEFDLRGELVTSAAAEPFVTDLTGQVRVTEAGVEIRTVTAGLDQVPLAALEALAPGLPLRGMVSGSIRMNGSPDAAPLTVDIRLEAGGGVITANGIVDLTGSTPSYDLSGRLAGVDLRQVTEPSVPPVQLHGEFELEGSGTDPTTADARLLARGAFTG